MNIKIEKRKLLESVLIVSRFAETKNATLPALTGVLFVSGDDGIKLRATNLETGIEVRLDGVIEKEGVVVLPAHTIKEICSSLDPKGDISLKKEGESITLTTSSTTSTIRTLPYEDFPNIPLLPSTKALLTLPYKKLLSITQSILPYASQSTIRPELASVLFTHSGGVLTIVATDSFRLAERKVSLPKNTPPFTFLIPAKNLSLILQSLPDEDVTIYADDNQCIFEFSFGSITSRLTQGTYPDYTQIIPKSFTVEVTLLKKDLENSLRRSAVFADTFQKVTVHTIPQKKEIVLTSKNNDIGESEEHIEGIVTGEEVAISFNHKYLSSPLQFIESDNVSFSISGLGRAAIIRGKNDPSFLYLVMPMNQ